MADYQTDEQVQTDPIDTLYQVVHDRGLYTKSLDEFKRQYSSPDQINKLYGVVKDQGLYSKSPEEFTQKYFPATNIPKIDLAKPVYQPNAAESTSHKIAMPQNVSTETTDKELVKRHEKAMGNLQQELLGNQDIIPDLIKKQKEQMGRISRLGDVNTLPKSDQPLTPAQQQLQQLQPNTPQPTTVSNQEVQDFHQLAQADPTAGRAFLSHVAQIKPEKAKAIQEGLYLNDAMERVKSNPQKAGQVLANAQKIAKGDLQYNGQGGLLVKPEGTFESIATGLQEKNKAFNDYDLFSNANPADAIKELEKRRTEHDPDRPVPVPENFGATFASGIASQPIKGLIAGKVAGGITAMIPTAEEFAPAADKFISAAVSGNDFRKLSYAHALQQYYNQLRNEGQSPEDAYKTANGQAKDESMVDAIAGGAMMYAGSKIGEIKLPSFSASAGYTTALKTALKQGAQGIGEAGAVGLIQAAGQDVKNKLAEDKGIQVDHTGKDIGEAFKSGALFTLGMAALAKGMGVMTDKAQTGLTQYLSKAPKEAVNSELGNLLLEGHITPEEAQKAATTIDEHRTLDQSIPENVTDESRMKIQDKIKRRQYLEMQLESADKAFHPEIKEKIKAVNDDILELSKDKKPRGQQDELSVEQSNAPRETIKENYNTFSAGDEVTSPHFEGTQKIRSVSPDGQSVFIEGEKDHHVHEVPISDVRRPGDITDDKSAMTIKPVSEKIEPTDALRTWDLGDMEGKPEDLASKKHLEGVVEKWDAKPATDATDPVKQGETFGQFVQRVIPAFDKILKDEPANTSVITHSSVLKAFKVWDEMGRPDISALTDEQKKHFATEFNKEETQNGDIETFKGDKGDIHVIRHGQTEDNAKNNFRSGDTNLTEKGKEQAAESGNQLGRQTGGDIPKIITSDLPRAVHTSNIIHDIVNPKTEENASTIRGDQGQVQEGGNAPERGQETRSNDIQQPPVEAPEHGQTEQQAGQKEIGGGKPPTGENAEDLPFGQLPVGISHEAQIDRAKAELNVSPPERGEGVTLQEAVQRGRDLIAKGTDPNQVLADFQKTGKISMNDMSVVRARYEQLAKATNDAYDTNGENSPEAKAAFKAERDWYNEAVKPMQTEWSKTGVAQQGATDVDTGTVMGIKRAVKERFDKDLTPDQLEKAKQIAEKNKELTKQVDELKKKLDAAHSVEPPKRSTAFTEKAKAVADNVRKLKTKEFTFKDKDGNDVPVQKMGIGWNELVELGAKAIEKTGEIADGIAAIIEKVKEADWYKALDTDDKERFEKELTDHYTSIADKKTASRIKALEKQLADLEEGKIKEKGTPRKPTEKEQEIKDRIFEAKNKLGLIKGKAMPKQPKTQIEPQPIAEKFANKKDSDFTPSEAKEIWQYTKDKYLDQGTAFPDALRNVATDLGLDRKQVLAAIARPKGAREITLEMYKKQYERTKAINSAKVFIETANNSKAKNFFNLLPSVFFNLKTYGHGTVGFLTHAGPNIFRPSVWKAYWPNFFRQFSFAYGNTGKYEMALDGLRNSPHYDEWKQAGLAVDPQTSYDEYQLFGIKQSKLGAAGTKGFNALKFLRYDMAESFYKNASDAERADPTLREHIAELVNHATGHTEIKVPSKLAKVFFAPGLEISRWQRMITDPAKALNTLRTWKSSTPAERAAMKIVFRGAGEKLATYGTLLAVNGGLLSAAGSKQNINLTDPSKSDWLKFKAGDETLDFTGGVLNPLRLLSIVGKEAYLSAYGDKGELRTKPGDKDASTLSSQMRYKLSPIAGSAADILTGTDAMGNPLPWSNVSPSAGRHKIDWTEFAWQQTPIPISAGAKAAMDGMRERGMSSPQINDIMNGLLHFSLEGFTGVKASPDYSLEKGGSGGGGGATNTYEITEWK